MATTGSTMKNATSEIDERSFKAGAVGISQEFVNFLREKNNERAQKERERMGKEAAGRNKRK